jgi:hypothetical protein
MKRLLLLIALSIGASIALAGENPAKYDTKTRRLSLSKVIIDDFDVTNSVTLQLIEITPSGNYLFELDPTTVTLNEPPVVPGVPQGTYKIGDTGPYGGIVFYISQDGSSGMEAALTDAGSAEWGCDTTTTGATGIAIGTGKSNTDVINAKCGNSTAAYLAANYKWPNGKTGGFLPSKDELNELYSRTDVVGGFASDYYWSSSEYGSNYAWKQPFLLGSQRLYYKFGTYLVRAVRAF